MRFALLISSALALSACQMQLPLGGEDPTPAPSVPISSQEAHAAAEQGSQTEEEALAAAFEDAASALSAPEPKGVLAFLKKKPAPSPLAGSEIEVTTGSTPPQGAEYSATAEATGADITAAAPVALAALPAEPADKPRKGLLGFLKPKAGVDQAPEIAPEIAEEITEDATEDQGVTPAEPTPEKETAALPVEPSADVAEDGAEAGQKPAKKGLFARLSGPGRDKKPAKNKVVSTVAAGEVLPFGQTGIACGLSNSALGKVVDQYPKTGRAVWKLHDTDPTATGARTQFVTGFADGCARQVTAALIIFGSAGVHETHRYSASNSSAWSASDKAYEKIKSAHCGVGRKAFCPPAKLPSLEQNLAFVSVYPSFGGKGDVFELLLHNRTLKAEALR